MRKLKLALICLTAMIFAGCTVTDRTDGYSSDSGHSDLESIGSDISSSEYQTYPEDNSFSSDNSSESSEQKAPEIPETIENIEPEYVAWMREEKVHEIRIEIDDKEWQAIRTHPYSGDYHPADVYIDGELVENIGLRTRGHASLYMAVEAGTRYPFKIKFDKYVNGQNFLGLDELALNNGGDDYSFMRDLIGYEAFELIGGYSSCVTFFNVYLNGELKGFYVGVEAIDTSYLERHFNSHKHNLYEGESGASLEKGMPLSNFTQKKGSDTSMEDIKRLIGALDETPLGEKGEIEKYLDVDSVLKMFAVNAVIDNRDGYCGLFAHNYYFYSSGGKLVMLPWDMNAPSVSAYTDIAAPAVNVYNELTWDIRPLVKKLMAVDEYYTAYLDYCRQLTEELPGLKDKVLRVYEMIRPHVENDRNKFCSTDTFNYQYSEINPSGVVTFLTHRYSYLAKRLKQLE
ncbi:MAG: CotH kinase family protein [Oscillospiraceae bacterium]|nr:CotH kinase family protein [Oscillospiraceae bacterium]